MELAGFFGKQEGRTKEMLGDMQEKLFREELLSQF